MCQAGGVAARLFASTAYRFVGEGLAPAPVIPAWCPLGGADRDACRLRIHAYRERKTGPQHRLAVVACEAHETGFFTLYPVGHVPYGRRPLSGLAQRIWEADDVPWHGTIFEAATGAARGERWSSLSPAGDPRRRRTQGRHLALAQLLTGTDPGLTATQRAWLADDLRVPRMALVTPAGIGWTARAEAVVAVLGGLPRGDSLPERLLAAGFTAALWPTPLIWSFGWRSPVPEHRRGRGRTPRAPPPTTSPGDG